MSDQDRVKPRTMRRNAVRNDLDPVRENAGSRRSSSRLANRLADHGQSRPTRPTVAQPAVAPVQQETHVQQVSAFRLPTWYHAVITRLRIWYPTAIKRNTVILALVVAVSSHILWCTIHDSCHFVNGSSTSVVSTASIAFSYGAATTVTILARVLRIIDNSFCSLPIFPPMLEWTGHRGNITEPAANILNVTETFETTLSTISQVSDVSIKWMPYINQFRRASSSLMYNVFDGRLSLEPIKPATKEQLVDVLNTMRPLYDRAQSKCSSVGDYTSHIMWVIIDLQRPDLESSHQAWTEISIYMSWFWFPPRVRQARKLNLERDCLLLVKYVQEAVLKTIQ